MSDIHPEHQIILDNAWIEFQEQQLAKGIPVVPYDVETSKLLYQLGFSTGVVYANEEREEHPLLKEVDKEEWL